MSKSTDWRLDQITASTLIVGVDIAKSLHWARIVDCRGHEIGKAISFKCNRQGFESIVAKIQSIRNITVNGQKHKVDKVIIGMEPTGHYWKTLADYLIETGYQVVCVNPFHTKRAKELDDNSQTKSDKKDALTIARLVKDGRFHIPYLPQDIYAELRVLSNTRIGLVKRGNAAKNTIDAILDEYFPEIWEVFKDPLGGKASRQILRACPFPDFILEAGEDGVLAEIRKAVKKTVGVKKARELIAIAQDSIGVQYGQDAARIRLSILVEELDLAEKHLGMVEQEMEAALKQTGYADQLLSVKGVGVVTASAFLGEVGDPLRFRNARQIANYAGYNLVEDSSGKSKSGTCISKRGRKQLRGLLYQMAFTMVGGNAEMRALYKHLITRAANPLKKKQALVVISKKIITVIYCMLKKQETYKPELVIGPARQEMMRAA